METSASFEARYAPLSHPTGASQLTVSTTDPELPAKSDQPLYAAAMLCVPLASVEVV